MELMKLEPDDIVLQVEFSEEGIGPWKIVKFICIKDRYLLQNKEGKQILVYPAYIRKVDGPQTKAGW